LAVRKDHPAGHRHNRNNIAESLGFQRRIVHGKNKSEWLRELLLRSGEPADPGMQQRTS
jgi:hypothetical protein